MIEERPIPLLDALEGRAETLLRLWRQERESRQALQQRLAELERCLAELEANRLELEEENRELDEQNRELEEHNRHLHERLSEQRDGQASGFPRPARRSQGLSALIGRRTVPTDDSTKAPATPEELPAGEGLSEEIGRANGDASGAASVASQEEGSPAPTLAGQQDSLAIGEAPSPQALLAEWYQRYPGAFFKGHTRPLKVGIHEELVEREPWPEKLVRRALACYVNLPRYLKAVREGAERIDLAGQPAGGVDAQAAEHARKKLDRLQADRQQRRGKAAGPGRAAKPRAAGRKPAATPADRAPAAKPAPAEAPAAPATLEEKLAALLAKHNGC